MMGKLLSIYSNLGSQTLSLATHIQFLHARGEGGEGLATRDYDMLTQVLVCG